MLAAGRLDREVQFLKRQPGAGYAALGPVVWGRYKPSTPMRVAWGDFRVYVPTGQLTVRLDSFTSTVQPNFGVAFEGVSYQIRGVQPVNRRDGVIVMDLMGAQDESAYRRETDNFGEAVTLHRDGIPDVVVNALIYMFSPTPLPGVGQQVERRAIVLASDLATAQFQLPFKPRKDRLINSDGRTSVITAVDDTTHRIGGVLIAYELRLAGS